MDADDLKRIQKVSITPSREMKEHLEFFDVVFARGKYNVPNTRIHISDNSIYIMAQELYDMYIWWLRYTRKTRHLKRAKFYREVARYPGLSFVDEVPEMIIIEDYYHTMTITERSPNGTRKVDYKLSKLVNKHGFKQFCADIFLKGKYIIPGELVMIHHGDLAFILADDLYDLYILWCERTQQPCRMLQYKFYEAIERYPRLSFCVEWSAAISIGNYRNTITISERHPILSTYKLSSLMSNASSREI